MTIEETCRNQATLVAKQFVGQFSDQYAQSEEQDLHNQLVGLIVQHMLPLLKVSTASAAATSKAAAATPVTSKSGKAKSEKASSRPNFYAFFHGLCSGKGYNDYGGHLAGYNFGFQTTPENPDGKKMTEKQQKLFDSIVADQEKLQRFKDFSSSVQAHNLREVVAFVESEFTEGDIVKIDMMTRTSIIWQMFLTKEDKIKFQTWYRDCIAEHGLVPKSAPAAAPAAEPELTEPEPVPETEATASEPVPEPEPVSVHKPQRVIVGRVRK